MKKTNLIVISLGVLLAGSPAVAQGNTARPNVVVMLVDDLGSGDVSCLFRDVVKTPNIDRLAKTGVIFTAGYSTAPLCGPSRAGFFSGVYQQHFGFVDNEGGIPAQQKLFPGVFHDAGYRTALIGKWHSKGPLPHERGCFDETLCSNGAFVNYHQPRLRRNGTLEEFNQYSTDLFADEAVKFIQNNKDKSFSLTVTFNAPHILKTVGRSKNICNAYDEALAAGQILDVPKEPMARPGDAVKYAEQFPGDTARADTVATIVALDQSVGRILDALKQNGLERNTVVFFFGDNGGHPENRSENLPLRNYKWTVYEGGVHVPFFAVYPGVFPAGLKFNDPVSTLDIFPTCAALAGAKAPANLDGIDLTPYLKGEKATPPHDALYFGIKRGGDYLGAVRQAQWKLILKNGADPELFDLSKDMEEKNNLAETETDQVKVLTAKWQAWDAQMPARKELPAKAKGKKGSDTEESE